MSLAFATELTRVSAAWYIPSSKAVRSVLSSIVAMAGLVNKGCEYSCDAMAPSCSMRSYTSSRSLGGLYEVCVTTFSRDWIIEVRIYSFSVSLIR